MNLIDYVHYALRHRRSIWAAFSFMSGFFVLIVVVSHGFLIPALQASDHATPTERDRISAYATLLLTVVLFILCVGIVLVFRVGRFFVRREQSSTRSKTPYVDAWAEAGRRAAAQSGFETHTDD